MKSPENDADETAAALDVAYILADYPKVSETFIAREIDGLRALGVTARCFALRRPRDGSERDGDTRYADLVRFTEFLSALRYFLSRSPTRLLREIVRALAGVVISPVEGLLTLRYLPAAIVFARTVRLQHVQHIHAHYAYIPARIAAIIARLSARHFSVSAHAWDIYTRSRTAVRRCVAGAIRIMVCSEDGRATVQAALPSSMHSRVVLAHHGLPLTDEGSDSSTAAITAVGRLVPKKGFAVLIEACAKLKERGTDFQCVIAGDGPLRGELEALARRLSVEDRVTFTGQLKEGDVRELYRESALLAMPSVVTENRDRDGIPNAILEAMAMRLPVVASRVGGIPEVVTDEVTGYLVPSSDARRFAERIADLLEDRELRVRMGNAGRQVVEAMFDSKQSAKRMLSLLRSAAA